MIQFCKLQFPIQARILRDPLGHLVDYPLNYGTPLIHWADPVRAVGWFRTADRILRDRNRLQALDAPVNQQDKDANTRQWQAQYKYVWEVLGAIAHGYNMLNIVWHNDPDARQLYRLFIAGPPRVDNPGATNSPVSALFAQAFDYNPLWYTRDDTFPRASSQNQKFGILQARAINQCASVGAKTGTPFGISAMMLLASVRPLRQGQDVSSADALFNVPMVRMRNIQVCGAVGAVSAPATQRGFSPSELGMGVGGGFTATNTSPTSAAAEISFPWKDQCSQVKGLIERGSDGRQFIGILPNGMGLRPDGFDDWRAAYYIKPVQFLPDDRPIVAASLRDYLPMLQMWVQALLRRSPQQIIQDSRAFTVFQNAETIRMNGSTIQQAWAAIAGTQADIESQKHRRSEEATIATASLAAAAAATSTVPVVSLILGVAAGIVTIVDTVVIKGTSGHGRDDLGRYKLQLERAWLSGDPSENTLQSGAPSLPTSELGDPPGRGVLWSPIANCARLPDLSGEDDKRKNALLISAAVAITAGVGYWLTTRES